MALKDTKQQFEDGTYNFRNLFNLAYTLRDQTKLLMKIAGWSQLLVMAFLLSSTIIVWVLLSQVTQEDVPITGVLVVATVALIQSSRLWAITMMAQLVVERVSDTDLIWHTKVIMLECLS